MNISYTGNRGVKWQPCNRLWTVELDHSHGAWQTM